MRLLCSANQSKAKSRCYLGRPFMEIYKQGRFYPKNNQEVSRSYGKNINVLHLGMQ